MTRLDDAPHVEAADRAAWRAWLAGNHATLRGAWLVTSRTQDAVGGLDYESAVEEALCFGWVDSTAGTVDALRRKLYFAPRKLRSPWAGTNKARVARLIATGRMQPAGLAAIERAKANGSWELLDGPERLEVPADLASALRAAPRAAEHFAAFPRSARKTMLAWVALAQRPETRARRVAEIAAAASRNERARS